MNSKSIVIRKAVDDDLHQIKELADAHKAELGFILRPALAKSIVNGEVIVATNGPGFLGFIEYHHRKDSQTTLYHLVVAPKYRQYGVGRKLMETLQVEALEQGKHCILLKCPIDLPANRFYERIGFKLHSHADGRHRKLNVWQLNLC